MNDNLTGHNAAGISITVEIRLFNSIARFARGGDNVVKVSLPAGSDIRDALAPFSIPLDEIFLIFVNGRDITPSLYDPPRTTRVLEDGDVVALSGPVPYSWGYGAPML